MHSSSESNASATRNMRRVRRTDLILTRCRRLRRSDCSRSGLPAFRAALGRGAQVIAAVAAVAGLAAAARAIPIDPERGSDKHDCQVHLPEWDDDQVSLGSGPVWGETTIIVGEVTNLDSPICFGGSKLKIGILGRFRDVEWLRPNLMHPALELAIGIG